MSFKTWLEATSVNSKFDKFFSQRDLIQKKDVGELLGFKQPLLKINQGSLATIYQHPKNPNWVIKVTSHKEDIQNIQKAQKLNSKNIVKMFGNPQQVPQNPNFYWIIVEKVNGSHMVYDTNSFIALIHGDYDEKLKDAATSVLYTDGGIREQILKRYGKNSEEELEKLSSLFETLYNLQKIGIEMSDFAENIMDDGEKYVIIDLGF
jgi:hypothetical protein